MKISKSKLKQLIAEELTEAWGGDDARVRNDPMSHSFISRDKKSPGDELRRKKEKEFRKKHQQQKADLMNKNSWLELEEGELEPEDWEQEHPSFNTSNKELNQAAWRKVAQAWEEGFRAGMAREDVRNEKNPYAKFAKEADIYEMVYETLMQEIKRKK